MQSPSFRTFLADPSGAVAALYALGLFALVGLAGVAFDYGRLASMDSELQNAADQAALAAATQLNGQTDAMTRARDEAIATFATAASKYVNVTRISNVDDDGDGNPRPITDLNFQFYSGYDYETDQPTGLLDIDTDDGEDAKVVVVTVNGREVFYALTPIVGALSSGDITASATATLQQASCDVVPMMFCSPSPGFGTEADRGRGLRLHMKPNSAPADSEWAPGNFGFLDIDYDTKGNPNRRLGINTQGGICIGGEIESDPGDRASEIPPFNTRFDRYENSASGLRCNGDGDYCSAPNVRQTYVQVQTQNNSTTTNVACSPTPANGNNSWLHRSEGGYPVESCIANNTCAAGDGVTTSQWSTYMALNHPGIDPTTVPAAGSDPTRYEMYLWESENGHLGPVKVASTFVERRNGRNVRYDVTNYCSYPTPRSTPFLADPDLNQKDRRVLTVASVDCTGLRGSGVVKILRWVDLFLVDSARITTGDQEFVAEVIGPAERPDGQSGFQNFGRGKAVLIR